MVFPRTALSVQSCVDHCLKRRYALAALQNGMFCMCGNDHKSMTPLAKRDGCNKMCGGTNEACGGFLQSSIYKTDGDGKGDARKGGAKKNDKKSDKPSTAKSKPSDKKVFKTYNYTLK
ncbi:predicted protein, partial [Nematostella vectensis]